MEPEQAIIHGTLRPDGTLELDEQPNLPAGRVRVLLQRESAVPQQRADTWTVLQRIWAERTILGLPSRTREEVDAEIDALRAELEEHAAAIERLQEEARQARQSP